MKDKFVYLIISLVLVICFVSIFISMQKILSKNNNEDNNNNNNNIENEIELKATKFVDFIQKYEEENRTHFNNPYNVYEIYNGNLMGYNLNTDNNTYIDNFNFKLDDSSDDINGKIITKSDGSMYFSIENKKKCVIKTFESDNIEIYNVEEKNKCHKTYLNFEPLFANIFAFDTQYSNMYTENTISNLPLRINAVSNLLDVDAATYKWYRNGILVENENSNSYLINSNSEDAEYYVEIETFDGKYAKSNPITIKIQQ